MTCDHRGDYRVVSSLHGLMPVRTYECACGESMTMHTLPQYLLKRMYGSKLNRSEATVVDPVPVDFCVALGGPLAIDLSRVCFESLVRTCADFQRVRFHLVNLDLESEVFSEICRMVPGCKIYRRPPVPSGSVQMGDDTEWTCEWMARNCGTEQFVVLCHFDLFFFGDFLNRMRSMVTVNTGMLGQHCPMMLLNREAMTESRVRFATGRGHFYATPHPDHPNQFFLYHESDPRADLSAPHTGFDQGELLELELRSRGWECDDLRREFENYFYHFSGGGRVRSGPEFDSLKRRVAMFTEEYGL